MSTQFTLVGNEDGDSFITVFVPGNAPKVAHSSHPYFEQIVRDAITGDPGVIELFDLAQTAAQRFQRLSERVTTANGRLYLDGVEVDNALSAQVLRFLEAGVEDWVPLVKFFENVQANPNEHSREQLYNWLAKRDFTITPDGLIVGYKGVTADFRSIHSGTATVDGVVYKGQIPNHIGAVVEMPRDQVQWDPSVGCHTGLHVGTYEYARNFGRGQLLEVHVNPRDVVSVPTDCDWAKVRCCRYVVVNTIDAPYTTPVIGFDWDWDYEDDDEDGEVY
ncbi:MAG: hypothetical protein LC118_17480 [Dehalococcoidia bacterium]|nr:hypothetical protein [Dehalococcoidia bacterium]